MKILKFGGTSVGTAESIRTVAEIIADYNQKGVKIAVVVSAQSGITNLLTLAGDQAAEGEEIYASTLKEIENKHFEVIKSLISAKGQSSLFGHVKLLLNELEDVLHGVFLLKEQSLRTKDLIMSFGERLSAYIIHEFLKQSGIPAEYLDARKIIITDDNFGSAKINFEKTNRLISQHFKEHETLQIVTGFISSNAKNQITTLGRGGSDYTAAVIGAALDVEEIEIWTDVDGMMTADPRKVKRAFSLTSLSYVEAMELTHFGAKIIYPPTLQPAFSKNIPLRIRNTFNVAFEGTVIKKESNNKEMPIKGISSIQQVSLVNLQGSGMVGVPGIASRLFGTLSKAKISVILITQASSEHSICFAIAPADAYATRIAVEDEFSLEIASKKIEPLIIEENLSILAIVGENMKNTPGIAGKLFGGLSKNGINIVAIAQGSSELNVSVIIKESHLSKALKALHGAFFLSNLQSLNLYVVGTGLIGGTLLKQIKRQYAYFYEKRFLSINIIALANSKKMIFDENGVNLDNWKEELDAKGAKMSIRAYIDQMMMLDLPNSIFVDNTSSKVISDHYEELLNANISVVTPNKLANSDSYDRYLELQDIALKNGVKFLYETNVGAGLPVISTLRDLKLSGDQIRKIDGILSGTISYIFNSFEGNKKFSEVVREAKKLGYTEPDPRDDLNGMDMARKILILSREAGISLELKDIKMEALLPDACFQASSIDGFFEELQKIDGMMEEKRLIAEKDGKKLRYIAGLENDKAFIRLEAVGPDSLFYAVSGSDNIIAYTSERYNDKPLVIKGPGAGAEVTAAGVFAEIIGISNYLSK